jgi:hypothetical protein
MTAGRGIVHSERTSDALRTSGQRLHGIQTWIALPDGQEEIVPAFEHVPAAELPVLEAEGARVTVILGTAFGVRSPVTTHAETLYADLTLSSGARLPLPADAEELAVYVVSGEVHVGRCPLAANTMGVVAPGSPGQLHAISSSRVMLIGGASPGERHIWWNFVSSRRERIEQAKAEWQAGGFSRVPGDDEFIPLPES